MQSKAFEAEEAISNGADEIDMVINICLLKEGRFDNLADEITLIKSICKDKLLKVIIETCLLTKEEKIKMCEIVTQCGADFIKTSTGFSDSGAVMDDIFLFKNHIGSNVKIKAAGGIRSLNDAEAFLEAGCSRLGTSALVKILKNQNTENY